MDKSQIVGYGKGILLAVGAVILIYTAMKVLDRSLSSMPKVKELADKV